MLAKSKLNSIETLISQALIDLDISDEEFITILKEREMKMEYRMKLWDLVVQWNQRFRKIKSSEILLNILYVINKNLFCFSCVYIKVKYYWVSCIIKKIIFFLAYI